MLVDLSIVGEDLNIVAIVDQTVGSINFGYDNDSDFRVENIAPHALGGDNRGDFNTFPLPEGVHTVTASAYENRSLGGQLFDVATIRFTVISSCSLEGQSCDDGDACTTGDRYNTDCNCVGVFQDADEDGVCDADDDCDGSQAGQSCDDGDACTTDDRYDADCNCVGTSESTITVHPIDDAYLQSGRRINNAELRVENNRRVSYLKFDLSGVAVSTGSAELTLTVGSDRGNGTVSVFYNTNDNWTENNLNNRNAPDAIRKVGSFEGSFSTNERLQTNINIDANEDVFTLIFVHEPNGNDISFHSSESRTTAYRPSLTLSIDGDCGETCSTIGQSCDDGDACTTGDVYDADCNCAGVFADTDSDGICDAEDACVNLADHLIGTTCDDGNPNTTNDVYTSDCECVGSAAIVLPQIIRLELYDTDSDELIKVLQSNDIIDLSVVGDALSILAIVDQPVGSIEFDYDGATHIENIASYALGGDARGDLSPFTFALGAHVLTTKAYESRRASGDLLDEEAISFTIIASCINEGQSCDDGDACTIGDAYDADCNCIGVYLDADNDGLCVGEDSNDNDPCMPDSSQCDDVETTDCLVLTHAGFEDGDMGIWIDGGTSARILNSSSFATTGSYSFYVQSNDGEASSLYSRRQDYSNYQSLKIEFNYFAYSVEDNDRFVVELDNGDGVYLEVQSFEFGRDFKNSDRKSASIMVDDFDLTDGVSIRFRSATADIADYIILDDIVIEGCGEKEVCTIDRDRDGYCEDVDSDDNDPCVPDASNCGGTIACQVISVVGFEKGDLGIWNDGGSDARILRSANFSMTGEYSFFVAGNSGVASSLYTDDFDFSRSNSVKLSFSFFPFSMERGDRFHVEVKSGSRYQTFKTFVSGVDFANEEIGSETVIIPASLLSGATSLRFRAEGDQTSDSVILDDVKIEDCRISASLVDQSATSRSIESIIEEDVAHIRLDIASVYPNPASYEVATVDYTSSAHYQSAVLNVVDSWGKVVMEVPLNIEKGQNVISFDPSSLSASTYLVYIQVEGYRSSVTKFVKFNY